MTQFDKVLKYLRLNNRGKGITAAQLSKASHVPKASVYRRVAEARKEYDIYTNTKTVNGVKRRYYRIAG